MQAAKTSLRVKTKTRRIQRNSVNKKWFYKDCRILRRKLREASNAKQRNPLDGKTRDNDYVMLRSYMTSLTVKK